MMRFLLFPFFFILTISTWAQSKEIDVYELPIPRRLENCFSVLDKTLSDNEKFVIRTYNEDSIYFHKEFIYGADFFHAWKLYDGSRLTKYFNKKGLVGSYEIYDVILVSYHRYLNQINIDLEGQIKKHVDKQKSDYEEHMNKMDKDSINGVYIPEDIEDCFKSLNTLLSKADIESIKSLPNRSEIINLHFGLGQWIRNNWGLWGGSRLQKYLYSRKIMEPDSMSSTILEFYYDWLNGVNEPWMKFDKKK